MTRPRAPEGFVLGKKLKEDFLQSQGIKLLTLRLIHFFQILIRSNMATRTVPSVPSVPSVLSAFPVLPERMQEILNMRSNTNPCPASVLVTIKSIPYFSAKPAPARSFEAGPTSRFSNLERHADDWRGTNQGRYGTTQNVHDRRRTPEHEEGFEVWNGHRRRSDKGQAIGHFRHTPTNTVHLAPRPVEKPIVDEAASSVPKFSFAAVKSAAAVEDRVLARVKGKINKIGPSTYEATKVFMQQILDSDEPGFLDEFMKFVFQKAAMESTFCSLYAKLLHELSDEFTHIRTVMGSLFRDYINIFKEVGDSATTSQSEYIGFVNDQERKKFRRGYSQFVAELVKLGEANIEDYMNLVHTIVQVLEENHTDSTKMLLCEEFIDCLATLCKSASSIMATADWSIPMKNRLEIMTKKPRSEVQGLTNKGRFALMDLVESASKGWK